MLYLYLYWYQVGPIGFSCSWRCDPVVWKIRVVWASTKEVEDNGDVEGKHGDGQIPVT